MASEVPCEPNLAIHGTAFKPPSADPLYLEGCLLLSVLCYCSLTINICRALSVNEKSPTHSQKEHNIRKT